MDTEHSATEGVTEAAATIARYLAALKSRALAADLCSEWSVVNATLHHDGTGYLMVGGKSFGSAQEPFAVAVEAIERAIAGPPFAPGDLVVNKETPQLGHVIVTACERAGAGWQLEYRIDRITGSADAALYVPIPAGWRDPPPRPVGAVELVELMHDGPIPADEMDAARAEHQARGRRFAAWCGEMARWWSDHGRRVNPERALKRAEGFAKMAARPLAAEAA